MGGMITQVLWGSSHFNCWALSQIKLQKKIGFDTDDNPISEFDNKQGVQVSQRALVIAAWGWLITYKQSSYFGLYPSHILFLSFCAFFQLDRKNNKNWLIRAFLLSLRRFWVRLTRVMVDAAIIPLLLNWCTRPQAATVGGVLHWTSVASFRILEDSAEIKETRKVDQLG